MYNKEFRISFGNTILNTHVMYGVIESIIHADNEAKIKIIPQGIDYMLKIETSKHKDIMGLIIEGAGILSDKILMEHKSLKKDLDIYSASLRQDRGNTTIDMIKLFVNDAWDKLAKKATATLAISPYSGKYLTELYDYKQKQVTELPSWLVGIAWIGFHYYAPYINYYYHKENQHLIYCLKPAVPVDYILISGLKDMKPFSIRKAFSERIGDRRVFIMYLLSQVPSILTYSITTSMPIRTISYVIARSGNNIAIRTLDEYNITRLTDFISHMKQCCLASYNRFITKTITGRPIDPKKFDEKDATQALVEMFYSILYMNYERIYIAMRKLRRLGFIPDKNFMKCLIEWFAKKNTTV